MTSRSLHAVACHCLLLSCSLMAVGGDIHVAPDGSNENPGTPDKPVATLDKAVALMADAGPGTIWLAPGQYQTEDGIRLDRLRGTSESPVVIRAIEPGTARLSGARPVEGFRPITAEEAEPLVSDEAKTRVMVADLAEQGFPALREMPPTHRAHGLEEVIFDDRPMQSARWPNEGFAVFTEVIDAGASKPTHWVQRDVYRPGSFRFPTEGEARRAARWDFERGVWLHGFWCYDWSDEAIKAASYDANSGELRLAAKHRYGIGNPWNENSKRRFYALHVFEELDQPGEYYLDRPNNRLYFWPPASLDDHPVYLTLCDKPLLAAHDVEHVVIKGLIIENGRGSGLRLSGCRHCRVEDCVVRNTGGGGIELNGTNLTATGCEVTGTAARGINVYGGDRKTLTPGNNEVVGCHIHHVGRLDWQGGRGISLSGCGNRAANNLIHHGPTGAVSYGGNEHVLELNDTHNMCIHYSDVGVFYTGRDWASRGNIVRWNYIHDNANNAGHGSSGIYLDDCDSGDTVVGNIVFGGVGRGVLLGGGRDNTIRGNIFIDLPVGIHVDARGPRGITLDKPGSWNLLAKCEAVGYLSPKWRERYPRLAATMDNQPLLPMGNVIHRNIMVDCKEPFGLRKGVDPAWLDREDNLVLDRGDVPFIPPARHGARLDLATLPKLWQKVPGFEPIPIERIGLPSRP